MDFILFFLKLINSNLFILFTKLSKNRCQISLYIIPAASFGLISCTKVYVTTKPCEFHIWALFSSIVPFSPFRQPLFLFFFFYQTVLKRSPSPVRKTLEPSTRSFDRKGKNILRNGEFVWLAFAKKVRFFGAEVLFELMDVDRFRTVSRKDIESLSLWVDLFI